MKKSITKRIFFMVMALLVLVFAIQWITFSYFFDEMYLDSIMDAHQRELQAAVDKFDSANALSAGSRDAQLRQYMADTKVPVLVVSENHVISDVQFLESLGGVKLQLHDAGEVFIPAMALYKLNKQPTFYKGKHIKLRGMRLGDSQFCVPMNLMISGVSYTNGSGIRDYKLEPGLTEIVDYGYVEQVSYMIGDRDSKGISFLYEQLEDCMVRRQPLEETLDRISNRILTKTGTDYAVYYEKKKIGSLDYYFITIRQVIVTGQEKIYISKFFYALYSILGVFLAASVWWISRHISKPLIHMSDVTQSLARLDFSQRAFVKGEDELKVLSENVNSMADNLQQSLEELNAASAQALENEKRMRYLLDDLAHEFKTPLFIISSYTEALETGISGEDTEKYYSIISSEVDKLSEMVSEVIELLKLQSGNWRVDIQRWELRDIVRSTMEKFERQFESENFSVDWNADETVVWMDARRIEQVLSNFLSNAIKYTDENKRIEIFTEQKEEQIVVFVGNSGTLTETEKERIWERYYTDTSEVQTRLPSEGIGLDIIRSILQAHESEHGVMQKDGMIYFYFTLNKAN